MLAGQFQREHKQFEIPFLPILHFYFCSVRLLFKRNEKKKRKKIATTIQIFGRRQRKEGLSVMYDGKMSTKDKNVDLQIFIVRVSQKRK